MSKVYPLRMRIVGSAVIALCVTAVLAGCAGRSPSGQGALSGVHTSPSPTATAPTTTPPTTPTTAPPATPPYPSDYPAAILSAWAAHNATLLALLTSDHPAILNIPGHPDQHWTAIGCDGAAGSNYCSYYNNNGDEITIRLGNEAIAEHHWHAGSLQFWDPMTYPTDATAYADTFVKAWIAGNKKRMQLLSTTSVTNHFLAIPPPDSDYHLTPNGTAGHIYVEITHSGGLDETIAIIDPPNGAHAIEDCFPTCS